jgi:hypothetical protein
MLLLRLNEGSGKTKFQNFDRDRRVGVAPIAAAALMLLFPSPDFI